MSNSPGNSWPRAARPQVIGFYPLAADHEQLRHDPVLRRLLIRFLRREGVSSGSPFGMRRFVLSSVKPRRFPVLLVCSRVLIALGVEWHRSAAEAAGASSIGNGEVAFHEVGRVLIDSTGTAQMISYFPYIADLPVSFFSGTPSETTAYFTLRSSPFQVQMVQNGNVMALFSQAVSASNSTTVYNVYFNPNPNENFADPRTFSQGQLIATFRSAPWMATATSAGALLSGTNTITSSSDFTIQGQTYNLASLGNKVTSVLSFGPSPTGGLTGGPLSLSFGGYGLAAAERFPRPVRARP